MDAFLMFMVPVFFFAFMFFVFGLGVIGATQNQINGLVEEMNCGMPQLEGFPIKNARYNWNNTSDVTVLTCTTVHTFGNPSGCAVPDGCDYHFGEPSVSFGFFFFVGDYISELIHKLTVVITMLFLVVTPPAGLDNFTVGAILITNILFFVYVIMYIMLGVGIYKMINPLSG